ncbi:MAG: diaminopimelate epimerase [Actinobacteria bacterium]|nr:MAG: diaminopimelate epimerase [Actinomycetota bacterium]
MRFAKYHGTGNDFVLVEDLDGQLSLDPSVIAGLCDRRFGVGADGLIRVVRGSGGLDEAGDADFFMDYYNANGEVAEMCGNGIRCLAKFVFDRRLTSGHDLRVATRAGLKQLKLEVRDGSVERVTVDMGPPSFERKAIGMVGEPTDTFIGQPLEVGGRTFTAMAVSMGNPHCVLFVDPAEDLRALDVPGLGSIVENRDDLFSNRTNVEFVRPVDRLLDTRVWERGSGETFACGTGACAALVAASVAGFVGREATVRFPGGILDLVWRPDDHVHMTGPAVCVFDGEVDEAWLATAARGPAR